MAQLYRIKSSAFLRDKDVLARDLLVDEIELDGVTRPP
jgi:hypothetical protein